MISEPKKCKMPKMLYNLILKFYCFLTTLFTPISFFTHFTLFCILLPYAIIQYRRRFWFVICCDPFEAVFQHWSPALLELDLGWGTAGWFYCVGGLEGSDEVVLGTVDECPEGARVGAVCHSCFLVKSKKKGKVVFVFRMCECGEGSAMDEA